MEVIIVTTKKMIPNFKDTSSAINIPIEFISNAWPIVNNINV
jgi:hypothetical protein